MIRVIPKKKALMTMHLVHRNAKSISWVDEETLTFIGKQDSTGHDVGSRTSKSSSPSEEIGSMILRDYCGAERFGKPGLFHFKPKAHVEEDEVPKDK